MKHKISTSEKVLLIEQYLTENYELRYNLLNKKTEVRARSNEQGKDFEPLTNKMKNSMVRQTKIDLEELTCVRQDVLEYLDSSAIPQYDPIRDYLNGLPRWDGQNRVAELFSRIPGTSSEQILWLSIWMRSAVAHWLGMDTLHGNECVPTLIGAQGSGKSTFCHRLLPEHLRQYFLDHLNLSNKNDKEMALTNNLLVNLDEMDQIRPTQQAELKQTLSKPKVNGRPIYGREQQDRTRYASFLATTNNRHPLQDKTGSRRYLCISIPKGALIDNETPINYEQLYAQLVKEVREDGMRYWFTNEETRQIQQVNQQFQQETDLSAMLQTCFRVPNEQERPQSQVMTVKEICGILKEEYPAMQQDKSLSIHVGMRMHELGFERKTLNKGNAYHVINLIA
ncbi:MAG: DUF3874 domain-containing protein [Bacteroidales bacterium]|nr:DUF3874 domain-containing protein [Bacteroidales bacterium]